MPAYGLTRAQSTELIVRTALEYGITDSHQIAYILVSAQHETDNFNTSREYDGPNQAIRRGYSGGANYYGRGYVQVTHDYNYVRMDRTLGLGGRLVADPDLAATDANLGAQTLVVGMARGLYTGVGIHRYIGGDAIDYENARRTVNGTDRAAHIASYAREWEARVPGLIERVSQTGIAYRSLPGSRILDDGELRSGERGIEVQYVQVALDRLGYRNAEGNRLATDGVFGTHTEQAVRAFQQGRGLNPTGVADQQILGALGLQQYLRNQNVQFELNPQLFDFLPPTPRMVNGMPDYLLPGRNAPGQAAPAAHIPRDAGGPSASTQHSQPAPAEPVRLPPLPPVDQLQPGDRGVAVLALQEHLRLLNARDAEGRELQPDRAYGERTQEAVENFQLWTGLPTTGTADRATLDALKTHAAYALQQRAQGIPPGEHLADNLKPNQTVDPAIAADPRPVQGRDTVQSIPAATPQPSTPTAPDMARAPLTPDQPDHPQHGLLQQIREQTRDREREGSIRFQDDREREQFCRYALTACKDNRDELKAMYPDKDFSGPLAHEGITRADHVVIGTKQYAFVVQVDIRSPLMERVAFMMDHARQVPIEQSDQKLAEASQEIAQQMALSRQQELSRGPDEPARDGPVR